MKESTSFALFAAYLGVHIVAGAAAIIAIALYELGAI